MGFSTSLPPPSPAIQGMSEKERGCQQPWGRKSSGFQSSPSSATTAGNLGSHCGLWTQLLHLPSEAGEEADAGANRGHQVKPGRVFSIVPGPRGASAQCTPLGPAHWATRACLDQSSQLLGHHDNTLTLQSSSWGLELRGPLFSVAPLLDLPMPLTAPPLPLPTEARCSCSWTRLVDK